MRMGRGTRRLRAHRAGLRPLLLAAPLGVAGLAFAWLVDGEPVDARVCRTVACAIATPEPLGRSFRMVLAEMEPDATPKPLVEAVPPRVAVQPVPRTGKGT